MRFLGAAVIFFLSVWGGDIFYIFFLGGGGGGWGVWGIQLFFLIGGGGICTFFKLTGSGGDHNCFLGGGGSVKKCLPPSPSD